MRLNLYDENMTLLAIIENFVSLLWNEGYNTVENFVLEVQNTEEFQQKLRPNCYIGRQDRKSLMVIKTVEIGQNTISASGKQASRVLDDVVYIGTIESGQDIPSSLRNAYGSTRGYPNVEIPRTYEIYNSTLQTSNNTILKICQTLCVGSDVGFRAIRSGTKIHIEFYQPSQKPNLVYSEKFGNVSIKRIDMSTEKFKNYAIVLGEGEGTDRTSVIVDLSEGGQPFQTIIDANGVRQEDGETIEEYKEKLRSKGVEELQKQTKTWNCTFELDTAGFGTEYDLGDIVTVLLPDYGTKLFARISKVSQKIQNNQTKTTVTAGELTIKR